MGCTKFVSDVVSRADICSHKGKGDDSEDNEENEQTNDRLKESVFARKDFVTEHNGVVFISRLPGNKRLLISL